MEHSITIHSPQAQLAATLHIPEHESKDLLVQNGSWPIIIICHGFIGTRIGVNRLFVKAARHLSSLGFKVLRFDYGGCGESTGDYGASGLDELIIQTRSVLDYAISLEHVDPDRVILLGHSLGGASALLTAARDSRVKKLVMWSAVAYPHHDLVNIVGREEYARLTSTSVLDHNGYGFTQRFFKSLASEQPLIQLRKYDGDVLVVHGTGDEVIPVDYAPLYQNHFALRSTGSCELHLVQQADHTYSSQCSVNELLQVTGEWLIRMIAPQEGWYDWNI
ncbi:alpha/beta fold hydrolase [Paenibacillus albiflavus]|uniref:Alpha/beta fold hydrolase n=1 Tax=Paenibacillus albiflavus TaxID=2545760 RepID=A0A4R4ELS9_9BACL|nr:alpha/beta fold hydrolase [Paenibacillus albiflavus]TCZ80989.1 alpha/beta fold hydrolase [Paenibacillus albiflavus]